MELVRNLELVHDMEFEPATVAVQIQGHATAEAVDSQPGHAAVAALIAAAAGIAGAVLAVFAPATWHVLTGHPVAFVGFLGAAAFLQLRVIEVPEQGSVSFASTGMLGAAFALGIGAAMIVAVTAATVRFVAARGRLDRAIFDAANLALATATAAETYHVVHLLDQQPDDRFGPSIFAATAFFLVNVGLLSAAMGLSEGESPWTICRRRLLWTAPWALAAGPFAAVMVVVYERIGILGIVALAVAPGALVAPVRQLANFDSDEDESS